MDEAQTQQTPEKHETEKREADKAERAEDRAHYVREDRIGQATNLAQHALQHGGLQHHHVPDFLRQVHATLVELGTPPAPPVEEAPAAPVLQPKVPVKGSIRREAILSLIDGKARQTLTRHLKLHGHTPESYRAAYGLPDNYPMVAPGFSKRRAQIAKAQGLGGNKAPAKDAAEPAAA